MNPRVTLKSGDEWVEGEELEFETLREGRNEYRCSDGSHGRWAYRLIKSPTDTPKAIRSAANELART